MVIGGTRGIGLGFVKNLLKRTEGSIVVTSRSSSEELEDLIDLEDRVSFFEMDAINEESIKETSQSITEKFGKISLVLNTCGVLHDQTTK